MDLVSCQGYQFGAPRSGTRTERNLALEMEFRDLSAALSGTLSTMHFTPFRREKLRAASTSAGVPAATLKMDERCMIMAPASIV